MMKKILMIVILLMSLGSCYDNNDVTNGVFNYDKGYSTNNRNHNQKKVEEYDLLGYEITTKAEYQYGEEIILDFNITNIDELEDIIVGDKIYGKVMPNNNFEIIDNEYFTINLKDFETIQIKIKAISNEYTLEKFRICLKFEVAEKIDLDNYYEVDNDEEYFFECFIYYVNDELGGLFGGQRAVKLMGINYDDYKYSNPFVFLKLVSLNRLFDSNIIDSKEYYNRLTDFFINGYSKYFYVADYIDNNIVIKQIFYHSKAIKAKININSGDFVIGNIKRIPYLVLDEVYKAGIISLDIYNAEYNNYKNKYLGNIQFEDKFPTDYIKARMDSSLKNKLVYYHSMCINKNYKYDIILNI